MKFGLLKTTLLDYPGRVAAVIFTTNCNLQCPYCHNPDLVFPTDDEGLLSYDEIRQFLKKRAPVLGGVVISGGEPLLHGQKIIDLIDEIHQYDLKVKVDTNGLYPDILPLLKADFIAMDLKTSPQRYQELGYNALNGRAKLIQSSQYIISSGVEHQFRTTVCEEFVNERDVEEMIPLLKGCKEHRLTAFRPGHTLSPDWQEKTPPSKDYMNFLKDLFIKKEIPSYIA